MIRRRQNRLHPAAGPMRCQPCPAGLALPPGSGSGASLAATECLVPHHETSLVPTCAGPLPGQRKTPSLENTVPENSLAIAALFK